MTPFIRPDERRHFKRFDMTTRDCRLVALRPHRARENCILVDLSYAGLRFRGLRPVAEGELLEFLVQVSSSLNRCGLVRGHVRWVRSLGLRECECGVEFLEDSKGLLSGHEN
jgi:PilZ domain-containing protein